MKYIILQGDGMADMPVEELGHRTPLEVADKPNITRLLSYSLMGVIHTIPEGLPPGSDVGNLSLLGYDPVKYYTGRAAIEAAAMGIKMEDGDVAYRCNLVTLSNENPRKMVDYSAGHITTEEAHRIIETVEEKLGSEDVHFYPGVSYRHIMLWKNGSSSPETTPPHDISGEEIDQYLPKGKDADFLVELIKKSWEFLPEHPVNKERENKGENPANSIWLWGQGITPAIEPIKEKYGITGAMISAVDLLKGLARLMGMKVINVPGATGYLDTNYAGKVEAALKALEEVDLVFVHIEAPDETGHQGRADLKVQAIEDFDKKVVGPIIEGLGKKEYRLLITPDHPTPVKLRTHTSAPVPFILFDSRGKYFNELYHEYNETEALKTGIEVNPGYRIMNYLLEKEELNYGNG